MLFELPPPSVAWAGKRVSASTHAGAFCGFEFRAAFWRRSSHALSGKGCAMNSAGEGRASLKASCAHTRQTAAKKIAKTARNIIWAAEIIPAQPGLQAQFSMRSELQTVCHFKYSR